MTISAMRTRALAVLRLVDHDVTAAVLAPDTQENLFILEILGQLHRVVCAGDGLAVDLLDDITSAESGFISRRIRSHLGHRRAFDVGRQLEFTTRSTVDVA